MAISSSGVYGHEVVLQVEDEPLPAARRPGDARGVRLARRVLRKRDADARDLQLGHLLDEEVVDLRIPRELVEVERLQRLQPILVELAVAHRGCLCRHRPTTPAATSRTTDAAEALHDVGHLVLRERNQLLQVGHRGVLRSRRGRHRLRPGGRHRRRGAVGWHDPLAQELRVALQRRIRLLERQAHPPGEQRVVAVVEGEPLGEAGTQRVNRRRPPRGHVLPDPQRVTRRAARQSRLEPRLHPPDLRRRRGERARGLLRVNVLDPDAGFNEADDGRRERNERCDLGEGERGGLGLLQVRLDRALQRLQFHLRGRRERGRIERRERGLPVEVEPLQPRNARRRQRLGLHRGAASGAACRSGSSTAAAAASTAEVVARESRAVERVARRHQTDLALTSREQRLQVLWDGRGRPLTGQAGDEQERGDENDRKSTDEGSTHAEFLA